MPGVAALAIAFVALALYDAPPPDDSEYKTPFVPVADETNAAEMLSRLNGKIKTDEAGLQELAGHLSGLQWHDFWEGDLVDFEAQVFVMVKNQEALGILSKARKMPDMQFGLKAGEMTIVPGPLPDPDSFFQACKVARISWQNIRDGKRIFAWEEALDHIQFAKKYGMAENVTLMDFLVGMTAEHQAVRLMMKNISHLNERDCAMRVAAWLTEGAYAPADFKHVFRAEYLLCDWFVSDQKQSLAKHATLRMHYGFKPNATRQRILDILKSMEEAIDRGDDNIVEVPTENFGEKSKIETAIYIAKPNFMGRLMLELWFSNNWNQMYMDMKHKMARTRLAACAFALRAYWLDHGVLPDAMDELVPTYVKSVPADAYGGKPVQYNKERAVVYSAGKERIYDDGAFALGPEAAHGENRPFLILEWVARP